MKQTQTQDITVAGFVEFLRSKGVISRDTKVDFVLGHNYSSDPRDPGTPVVKTIRLTKEIEVTDILL
jgi:hypothetical protein